MPGSTSTVLMLVSKNGVKENLCKNTLVSNYVIAPLFVPRVRRGGRGGAITDTGPQCQIIWC